MSNTNSVKDFEELQVRFDELLNAYSQVSIISDELAAKKNKALTEDSLMKILNQCFSDLASEVVSKVRFYESLVETLLQDRKNKKKNAKNTRAA